MKAELAETTVEAQQSQLGWMPSVLRTFCEIPLADGPYKSVELQTVEHEGSIGGVVLLRRRDDRMLEIHVEPHLGLDDSWPGHEPALMHQEVHSVHQTELPGFVCTIERDLVEAQCAVRTLSGLMSVYAHDASSRKQANVFTPAPPGTLPQNPRFLVMGIFGLLSRSATVETFLEGRRIQPKRFTLGPLTFPVLEARIGGDLVLGTLTASPEQSSATLGNGDQFLRILNSSAVDGEFGVHSSAGPCATGTLLSSRNHIRIDALQQDWNPGKKRPLWQALRLVRLLRRKPANVRLERGTDQ